MNIFKTRAAMFLVDRRATGVSAPFATIEIPQLWALNSAVECHLHTVEVTGSNPVAPTIESITYRTSCCSALLQNAPIAPPVCLKSWCYGGIRSTRIAIWAVAITQVRLVTALDRGRHRIVLFGENHLPQPLLRLPLGFDPRLRIDLEGKPAAGMAHEFLDDLYVLSIRDQQG